MKIGELIVDINSDDPNVYMRVKVRDLQVFSAELEGMRAEVTALRRLLLECAEEIEADVKERYGWPDVHPAQKSKYDAEMELVNEAKKAAKGEE